MRLRHTLKAITWSAAAVALAILILGKDKDYAWIGVVVLAALCLHFSIETAALLRRARFRHRLADSREFKEHRAFLLKDLGAALAADSLVEGVTIPVILDGIVTGQAEKGAPLSGRKALAWRVVAEPLEGFGKVGARVLPVDSYWGEMRIRDGSDVARVAGPGVLDGSSLVERVVSLKTLRSDFPGLAPRIEDGLGFREGKDAKSARIALREIALFPNDKVRVYGTARRTTSGTEVSGPDTLEDPGSLLVRAAVRPASARMPRRLFQAVAFAGLSLVLLAGFAALATRTAASSLFAPGGIFDATRTGKVSLDLDGRQIRVSIGDSHWTTAAGDRTRGFALAGDSADFMASRSTPVTIQAVSPVAVTLHNGDPGYPRWDGTAWVMETGTTAVPAATEPHSGRLYIRNLTGSAVTVRVLRADGTPVADTTWSFAAYEGADDPRGQYLSMNGAAVQAGSDARIEITTRKGSLRILPLASAARWGSGSWLLELGVEYLAGSGKLYVKNSADSPVRIWVLGADGNALYGDDPWVFEPREGAQENKGLRLTYGDKDIVVTGREAIRVETQQLATLAEGTLERVGSWRRGTWTIDLARFRAATK